MSLRKGESWSISQSTCLIVPRKMLMRQRNSVMSMAMRPAMTWGGMRKETQETTTKRPEGT